ncbi:hypothetical protein LZ30DRAFT_683069 [Colletotrichum cereale]|nr:hypothetical protein LZ30DRAFT_683069 [Colletotrichum cereale]
MALRRPRPLELTCLTASALHGGDVTVCLLQRNANASSGLTDKCFGAQPFFSNAASSTLLLEEQDKGLQRSDIRPFSPTSFQRRAFAPEILLVKLTAIGRRRLCITASSAHTPSHISLTKNLPPP